jgi:predicted transcriptional regulator
MTKKATPKTEKEKLDEVIRLLQIFNAIQLHKDGVTQEQIGKTLGIAKASVNQMLKGTKKDK